MNVLSRRIRHHQWSSRSRCWHPVAGCQPHPPYRRDPTADGPQQP